jgi:hypothetical protein
MKDDTAIIDLVVFNRALTSLQTLSGEVSHVKVHPIVQDLMNCIIPPEEDTCRSATPQKNSSKKSATEP